MLQQEWPWNLMLSKISQTQKDKYCMIALTRVVKFIETENRTMVARGQGQGEGGVTVQLMQSFGWGRWKISGDEWRCLRAPCRWTVHVQTITIEIRCYMCFTTMKSNMEKAMATHSSIPAWEIPSIAEPGRLRPWGRKRIRHGTVAKQHHVKNIFKGKGYIPTSIVSLKIALKIWN